MANGDISKAVIGAADGTGITTKKTIPISRAGSINTTDARHQLSLRDDPFDPFVADGGPKTFMPNSSQTAVNASTLWAARPRAWIVGKKCSKPPGLMVTFMRTGCSP